LEPFDFHGFKANRRVTSYGWRYDFDSARLVSSNPIPDWLLPVRKLATEFAGLGSDEFRQVLISEYSPGAGIGWHKDKAVYDKIVGVSLGSVCTLRFRRPTGGDGKWHRYSLPVTPGSFYLLSGDARAVWEHSIPAVTALRYSLTFRSLDPDSKT
jgi:alkylated DNA repair dioxygenase AlkB